MRRLISALVSLACLAACAPQGPPPGTPKPSQTAVPAQHLISRSDCVVLADWIKDKCQGRETLRLARVDGWCGQIEQHSTEADQAWIDDCAKHVTDMDNECFRSTSSISNLMACDSVVAR